MSAYNRARELAQIVPDLRNFVRGRPSRLLDHRVIGDHASRSQRTGGGSAPASVTAPARDGLLPFSFSIDVVNDPRSELKAVATLVLNDDKFEAWRWEFSKIRARIPQLHIDAEFDMAGQQQRHRRFYYEPITPPERLIAEVDGVRGRPRGSLAPPSITAAPDSFC